MLDANTFTNNKVIEYQNQYFINLKVDASTEYGMSLFDEFNGNGYPMLLFLDNNKNTKGVVTSGTYSPTLKKSIALARIPPSDKRICFSELRGKMIEASIGKPRFVKEGKIIF